MARPRKFDEGRAVEAAMRAFWADGYEATSTQELCAATGLGRSSIYNTFASKHELFVKALAHYMDTRTDRLVELLKDGDGPVRERLRTVLEWAVAPDEDDPSGCLVVNATVELGPHDPDIAERLERDRRRRFATLKGAVQDGMRTGEIEAGKDAEALAHFMISTISGIQVAARGGADRGTLKAIADTAMQSI
ncbi:TetR/AcrR family transcriptional regulator [Actinomadura darangshiensis]|uniref:TetR/AcrR family transcriptional regulator n=1 Tax=Actinomadura darangshiensis TaxID=705336 RepID=A0A4R5B0Z3_9ACTN|nr:TetR/AcrR family transcriptional regulator [Actinomadura darangshiensis]TDD76632.1 TetR/AcrR family transcriptional regulator [Actinomadura darangshiensis]